MVYRSAADLVLLAHLAFVLFVALGGLLAMRWPKVALAHVPAVVWGVIVEYSGWTCPLTPLESTLRRLGGEAGYAGGFIDHYAIALLYPAALTRSMQLALGTLALGVNAVVYLTLLRRRGTNRCIARSRQT